MLELVFPNIDEEQASKCAACEVKKTQKEKKRSKSKNRDEDDSD